MPTHKNRLAMSDAGRRAEPTVGVYKKQGQLDGRWVDTIIMEKLLDH